MKLSKVRDNQIDERHECKYLQTACDRNKMKLDTFLFFPSSCYFDNDKVIKDLFCFYDMIIAA